MFSKLFDSFLVHYLERFNDHCFTLKIGDNEYTIGDGESEFTVIVNRDIPKKDLLISAELALGEAYMRKDIEIEGDLFKALCVVLGHVGKDSINRKVLSSLFNAFLSFFPLFFGKSTPIALNPIFTSRFNEKESPSATDIK